MTPAESMLLDALRELDQCVRQLSAGGPKANLTARFERMDQLAADLGPAADPQLVHYMRRKSYQKAQEHLEAKAPRARPVENAPPS